MTDTSSARSSGRSSARRAQVHVHGPALRFIREQLGRKMPELATALRCQRNYITRLELGHSRTCSPAFFTRLVEELGLPDHRVLLACPYGESAHGGQWNPDSDVDTGELPRLDATTIPSPPRDGQHGRHRRGRREPVHA